MFKNNLPMHVTTLIGREQELGVVSALLRHPDVCLLTLTGMGPIVLGSMRWVMWQGERFDAPG
jgi:hypothetical protein